MKKPLIGVTPSLDQETKDSTCRSTYQEAVRHAGGIPVILPLRVSKEDLAQLASTLDGFLFTGGPDIHPFLYGEETREACGNVAPERDQMELSLLPLVMETKKPILGICRGIQLLNVGLGGTLYQDIPSQVSREFPIAHKQPFHYLSYSHRVAITPKTRLCEICQSDSIPVNSSHHQAIKDLAPGLTISGKTSDGLIEAIEKTDYPFFVGVQWHPEYLWPQDEAAARLFQAFVNACRESSLH